MSSQWNEIYGEVTFMVKRDQIDALKVKARELDDPANQVEVYTIQQALQVVWHQDPAWLHEHVLIGWILDKASEPDDRGTMRGVWAI